MRPLSDTEINSKVRRVMVQHWIDLGRLTLRTTRGVVTLSGVLAKLRGADCAISHEEIDAMLLAIRQIPSVRRVQIQEV